MTRPLLFIFTLAALAGCRSSGENAGTGVRPDPDHKAPIAATATTTAPATALAVGSPAPAFELVDLDGKTHKLADYKGKRVVLEWFNPDCPFVKASHGKGSLRDYAKRASAQGVVWLAINSSAPGKQGSSPETNRKGKELFSIEHPILFDPEGKIGKAYGATNTPNMFVIDEKGVLVYRGAIDNSPDGEGESPAGGKLINHVEAALGDLAAGRPVQTPQTKAYGCSVKYASM